MRIVIPKTITDGVVLESNLSEDEYPAHDMATNYAKEARVIVVATHKIYESLIADNLGKYPPDNVVGLTASWKEVGPTNAWAMFDTYSSTQAENAEEIVIKLDGARCSAVYLSNLEASELEIAVRKGDDSIFYTETIPLLTRYVTDFYQFLFAPFERVSKVLRTFAFRWEATIELAIRAPGGTAKCGRVIIGEFKETGLTQYDITISNKDFSTVETDTYGTTTLVKRSYVNKIECTILQNEELLDLDEAASILFSVQFVPTVYDFNNSKTRYECVQFLGYSSKTELNPIGPNAHKSYIEVTGLP